MRELVREGSLSKKALVSFCPTLWSSEHVFALTASGSLPVASRKACALGSAIVFAIANLGPSVVNIGWRKQEWTELAFVSRHVRITCKQISKACKGRILFSKHVLRDSHLFVSLDSILFKAF